MKQSIIILLLTISIINVSAQAYSEMELKTIHSFFTEFKINAKNKDKLALLRQIHPMDIENKNTAELLANKALESDETSSSDFAYSDKAMAFLISNYLKDFKPLSNEIKSVLYQNDEFHKAISKKTDKQVAVFSLKGTNIILLLDEKNTKLLFWEGLNNLINNK